MQIPKTKIQRPQIFKPEAKENRDLYASKSKEPPVVGSVRLSAVVITLNEEKKLPECLASVAFADEIVVVDSLSTDATREVALRHGARFFTRPFDNFSNQKNFAMDHAQGDWILFLDADERVSLELQREISNLIAGQNVCDGYFLRRQNFIFGRKARFGNNAGDQQLRLVRKGSGRFCGLVHERVRLEGKVGALKAPLLHHTFQNMDDYFRRFYLYTRLEAEEIYRRGYRPTPYHLFLKPFVQFLYFYFLRLGFLDGLPGLRYQIHSCFYTYAKYAKALEWFDLERR